MERIKNQALPNPPRTTAEGLLCLPDRAGDGESTLHAAWHLRSRIDPRRLKGRPLLEIDPARTAELRCSARQRQKRLLNKTIPEIAAPRGNDRPDDERSSQNGASFEQSGSTCTPRDGCGADGHRRTAGYVPARLPVVTSNLGSLRAPIVHVATPKAAGQMLNLRGALRGGVAVDVADGQRRLRCSGSWSAGMAGDFQLLAAAVRAETVR